MRWSPAFRDCSMSRHIGRWAWRWSITGLLLLSPLLAWADKSASDYFVRSLPGAPEGPLLKMHAGHITVNAKHNGNLFFWHYQNRHIANRQRTVIWLNGGPGCSSEDGALMEVGPYRVKDDGNLRYNDGSWDEFAHLLFVDQPVGTGFSYVDTDSYVTELSEMADQFIIFLIKFFSLFPQYEHDDIYIAGESYAGQHIPYIASAILARNALPTTTTHWNLSGLLIGNGWISPVEQYMSYLPFAYKSGIVQGGSTIATELESRQSACNSVLSSPNRSERVDVPECEAVLQDILKLTIIKKDEAQQCVNMYDVRLRDSYPSCGMNWPPDLKDVTPYLRRADVVAALNIDNAKKAGWTECSGAVGGAFRTPKSKPSIHLLPDLLAQLPIVLFSGAEDLICNHIGTEELIHNMSWNGATGFELSPGTWAPRRAWTFEGEAAGIYQEARNLTYILFYNSSHMVPFDYPRRSRDMLDRFLGVDIASIGGVPADSRIDGEKGLEVSVGGHPNSTVAEKQERTRLQQAKWAAYYKSGEIALVFVVIAAVAWGWYVYRDRRRRAGYQGLFGGSGSPPRVAGNGHVVFADDPQVDGMGLENPRSAPRSDRDLEVGLDDLTPDGKTGVAGLHDPERYSLGGASSEDDQVEAGDYAPRKR